MMDEEGYNDEEIQDLVDDFKASIDNGENPFVDSEDLEIIAEELVANFDFRYARAAVDLGLQLYPSTVEFRLLNVKLHIMEFDLDKAREELDAIESEFPPCAEIYLERAFYYKMANSDVDTLPIIEKAYEMDPENVEINFMLGGEYVHSMDFARGLEYVSYALENDEEIENQLFTISYVFEDIKEVDAAVEFFAELTDRFPLCKSAWFALGLAYSWKREFEKGIDAYYNAISLDPEASTAYFNIGNAYYEMGDFDKAIENYRETYRLDDQDYHALSGIADCYYEMGDMDNALLYYQKALAIESDASDAIMGAITVLKETGRENEAEAFIMKAFSVNPQTFEMLFKVLPFFKEEEKISKLKELFHLTFSMLSYKDDFLKIFTMYCITRPELCAMCIEVLEEYRDNEDVTNILPYLLAALHYCSGNHAEAANYLKRALLINYDDHDMFLSLYPDLLNDPAIIHLIDLYKPDQFEIN